MEIRQDQLAQILPGNPYIEHWCEALNKILPDYDITTPQRVAAFLAQTAHESGGYTALHENLNYQAASLCRVWPSHFPNMETANQYAHNPERITNRAYAGRMGNGDKVSAARLAAPVVVCPHCDTIGKLGGSMSRWHFDNCRDK